MHLLLELAITFAKIGLFTFGGGYAMISVIEHSCVEQKNWITHEDMMNMTVIAESTPGPIAINCSTFVGYKQAGIPGALLATFGVVLPSFVIIYLISMFLNNFLEIPLVMHAFQGIKIAVGLLILDAAFTMIKKMKKDIISKITLVCSAAVMLLVNLCAWNFSSISMILIAAAVGLTVHITRTLTSKERGDNP